MGQSLEALHMQCSFKRSELDELSAKIRLASFYLGIDETVKLERLILYMLMYPEVVRMLKNRGMI